MARIASIGIAVFAMAATLVVGSGLQRHRAGEHGVRVRGQRQLPGAVLALTWRRFNTAGALTGVAFGVIASIVMIALSPPVWPGPDSEGSPSSLTFPGLVTIPIGFLGCWLGTMLATDARRRRAPTTSCSCARRPASAPRARTRAGRRGAAGGGGRRGHVLPK